MTVIKICVAFALASMVVLAESNPQVVKDFSDWISDVEYDVENDSYIVRLRPTAKACAYVVTNIHAGVQKVQPGETYAVAFGKRTTFTQFAGSTCSLTFTNGMQRVGGVVLPIEFQQSSRQLWISVKSPIDRDHEFERRDFVVAAEGLAYDATTRQEFHFGVPFHAHYDKVASKLSRSMEKIQRAFREEGGSAYKKALSEINGRMTNQFLNEGVTNAVSFIWETGGVGNLSEKDRSYLIKRNPEAARLFAKLDASRRQDLCVAFCSNEGGNIRILAVARAFKGKGWRFWTYSRSGAPKFVFLGDGHGTSDNYYEYGENGLFRNFCLVSKFRINYHAVKDGVLQKSSDTQKAQEFISKVEGMFNHYAELDSTGTLKKLDNGR